MSCILLIGATGFIGQALGVELVKRGHTLRLLSRGTSQEKLAFPCQLYTWPGDGAALPAAALDGVEAVVNLAGESIAAGRWSKARKDRFRSSRLGPTAALVNALSKLARKPRVVVQASAIGYYGDTGEQVADEAAAAGQDFLAQLCVDWEQAAAPVSAMGVRLAVLRIGVVLGLEGGALPQLSRLYRLGVGAVPGDGRQWFSWIHLHDLVQLFANAIDDDRYRGAVNATAPEPVRYADLHRLMTQRQRGPLLKAPAPLMRAAVGEAATMLLASLRVAPSRALQLGFSFKYAQLRSALDQLLGSGAWRDCDFLKVAQWVPAALPAVTAFFSEARNLEGITPPWLQFNVVDVSTPQVAEGTKIRYRLKLHGVPINWVTLISAWDLPRRFVDEQLQGPFKVWHHTHEFMELGGGTVVSDLVRFKAPLGILGGLTAGFFVDHDVKRIFRHRRHEVAKRFP